MYGLLIGCRASYITQQGPGLITKISKGTIISEIHNTSENGAQYIWLMKDGGEVKMVYMHSVLIDKNDIAIVQRRTRKLFASNLQTDIVKMGELLDLEE
jgi:hypothetical protein